MGKGNGTGPQRAQPSKIKLIDAADLRLLPSSELLSDTHIVAEGFNVIFGAPGSFKSFYTLGVALHVAQSAGVIYVAAEGARGFHSRIDAWCDHNKLTPGHLKFINGEINLLDATVISDFVQALKSINKAIRLVIFDTYARCMPGGDENSAKDVGLAIRHCGTIQRTFKTAIAVVHHTNRADTGERGSGALRGAADSMIEVNASADTVRIECSKMKDWEPWPAEQYRFMPVGKSGLLLPAGDVNLPDQITNKELKILEALNLDVFEFCGARAAQIVDATGISRSSIFTFLSKLKSNDLVSQGKHGDPFKITAAGRKILFAARPELKKQQFSIVVE